MWQDRKRQSVDREGARMGPALRSVGARATNAQRPFQRSPNCQNRLGTLNFCWMRTAFKEWAIVVDALGRGEQILILRKGGIAEGRGGFRPEHTRFLLFPTAFHEQR